jgi:hypothetical protein
MFLTGGATPSKHQKHPMARVPASEAIRKRSKDMLAGTSRAERSALLRGAVRLILGSARSRPMGSLPRNASGKIRHRSLAETLQESLLGLRRHTTEIRALATASEPRCCIVL